MKQATVKYAHSDKNVVGTLIETIADIKEYQTLLSKTERTILVKFVKSGEPDDRLDHVVSGLDTLEGGLAQLALLKGRIKGDSAIYHLGEAKNDYMLGLANLVIAGEKVFINPTGGYCSVREGVIEIVKTTEVPLAANGKLYHYISKDTKVINLENDFKLEKNAINYMEQVFKDKNYSYIKELRLYNKRQLKIVFEQFVKNGGDAVYVYTTGRDVEQMYEYSECAIECGLKKFIFQFKVGTDNNIQKFLDWLGKRANIKVV